MGRSSRALSVSLLATAMVALTCGDPPETPPLAQRRTPVPEETSLPTPEGSPGNQPRGAEEAPSERGRRSPAKLAHIPGAVRWTVDLGAPITFIRWSPLKGLIVSAGSVVHNVTSRAQHRWRFVAGREHRLFDVSSEEVVWSPEFGRLNQLRARGREGWARKWRGRIVSHPQSGVYLLDAGTVAALGPDGRDRWRASPEGVRELEGPFPCREGSLFHGMSGMQRVAVRIGDHGSVLRETPLGRGAVLIGASSSCQPLVWLGGEVKLLNDHGEPIWRRPAHEMPITQRITQGFALMSKRDDDDVALEVISDSGQASLETVLPVGGSLTAARAVTGHADDVIAVALCLGVTSPCSKPSGTRGPYNTLLTRRKDGTFRTLIRHVRGHLGIASIPSPEQSLLTASSVDGETTDLTLRDSSRDIAWQVNLPGRLSAGPYLGPMGGVYVGTCRGYDCAAPHQLIAVTGRPPAKNGSND